MTERVYIEADDAGRIVIMAEDEKGNGDGYRIAGPKPCAVGPSCRCYGKAVAKRYLDERDVSEIRHYLNRAAPSLPGEQPGGQD